MRVAIDSRRPDYLNIPVATESGRGGGQLMEEGPAERRGSCRREGAAGDCRRGYHNYALFMHRILIVCMA